MLKDTFTTLVAVLVGAVPVLLAPRAIVVVTDGTPAATPAFIRAASILIAALGVIIVTWVSVVFVTRGRGTPIPILPPKEFVAQGLYRYVRNPMYVGGLLIVLAQTTFFLSPWLFVYILILWLALHSFIVLIEEPQLERRFGGSYRQYKARTPRWIPRRPKD
jgi:protein-S-isoprenylcysteine O-methyltransferase Ste14